MEPGQIKQIIEALLFTSDKPLTITQIKEVLEDVDTRMIKSQIEQLRRDYTDTKRSFNIVEIAGGFQISTDPRYAPWLQKLYRKSHQERLSRPSLETLAIIAYRQPITRLEIEDIRGVNVDGVLKTLLEKSLVRIYGRKQVPGRPFLYSTTRQFLEFFGLGSLEDLPRLEEFEGMDNKISYSTGGKKDGEDKKTSKEDRPD